MGLDEDESGDAYKVIAWYRWVDTQNSNFLPLFLASVTHCLEKRLIKFSQNWKNYYRNVIYLNMCLFSLEKMDPHWVGSCR